MTQQTNFPVSNFPFVDAEGRLSKEGRTLLRTLWLASAGAPQQTGWTPGTTTVNQGPLADYGGSAVPADLAVQVVVLTEVLGTLINALASYGILDE